MIRHHALAFRTTLMLADGGMGICLAWLLSVMRFGGDQALPMLQYALPDPAMLALLFALAWVASLWMSGLYRPRAQWSFRKEAVAIVRVTL